MLSNKHIGGPLAATAAAALLALAVPAGASAQPSPGSAEGAINSGSALLDSGSAILDGNIVDGARGILNTGSSIINSLPGTGSIAPRQRCNEATLAGGPGVTQTQHDLGRSGPLTFQIRWETYAIPDIIEVFYQGAYIFGTGPVGDDINEGTGSANITLPPGTDTTVLVKVTGPGGTEWDYTVGCPFA